MRAEGLFITGTDTGIGKTWVATRLVRSLRESGIDVAGMKPVECGGREDSLAIFEASGGAGAGLILDEVNPLYFPEPLAPAAIRGLELNLDAVVAAYEGLAGRFERVIVEGAGGWLVPLDRERTMADLAARLGLPVLVVAPNRLGVLNHALLTVRAIRASGLECRGIFLNEIGEATDVSRESNARVLREVLPEVAVFENDPEEIAHSM